MENKVVPRGCDSAKVVKMIQTKAIRGSGTKNDPCREVIQYWSFEGVLLFEHDPAED